jgi:hypothetical protein
MIMLAVAIALVAKSASAQNSPFDTPPFMEEPPPPPAKAKKPRAGALCLGVTDLMEKGSDCALMFRGEVGYPFDVPPPKRSYKPKQATPFKDTLQGQLQEAKVKTAYLEGKQEGEERLNSYLHVALVGFVGALLATLIVFFSFLVSFATRRGFFGPVNEPKCDEVEDS